MAVFLIGLGIVSLMDEWWPGIMLVIGASLTIRQLLLRKYYEMCISIIVFIGVFITEQFTITWKALLPVIFFTSALFVLMREYVDSKLASEDQREEDLNHEIEEEIDEQKHQKS